MDYLAREEELERGPSRFVPDFDENDDELGFEARKRSIFRERDGKTAHFSNLFCANVVDVSCVKKCGKSRSSIPN